MGIRVDTLIAEAHYNGVVLMRPALLIERAWLRMNWATSYRYNIQPRSTSPGDRQPIKRCMDLCTATGPARTCAHRPSTIAGGSRGSTQAINRGEVR